MNVVNMPGFTAEKSLDRARGRYRTGRRAASRSDAIIPAIPNCANCDWILEQCELRNWRPRAVCNACATGYCYEEPPMPNPFPDPFPRPPRF